MTQGEKLVNEATWKALFELLDGYSKTEAQLMVPAFQFQLALEAVRTMRKENERLRARVPAEGGGSP